MRLVQYPEEFADFLGIHADQVPHVMEGVNLKIVRERGRRWVRLDDLIAVGRLGRHLINDWPSRRPRVQGTDR